jgi:hypothetical protein
MRRYTLRTMASADETLLAELAGEWFNDLDQARDVALSLCHEFGVDIQIIEHYGISKNTREIYDAATYA